MGAKLQHVSKIVRLTANTCGPVASFAVLLIQTNATFSATILK